MFEKTQQRIDSYTLNVYGKLIELKYRIKTYQYIEKQDKDYIKKLREAGAIITTYRKMDTDKDKVIVKYYMLVDDYISPLEERIKVVEEIMNTEIECNDGITCTVQDFINGKWDRNTKKMTSTELMDKEAILLDYLSSYITADLDENEYVVISPEKFIEFDKKICYELSNGADENNGYIKATKAITTYDNVEEIPTPKPSWKSSKTYRLNDLFTFDNNRKDKWSLRIARDFDPSSSERLIKQWCKVDTEGYFKFNGETYKVTAKEYNEIKIEKDSYKNEYQMAELLVIKQGTKFKVYNQDIFEINDKDYNLI